MFLIFFLVLTSSQFSYQNETQLDQKLIKKCLTSEKNLPKALIIGVKKSGTYALLRYLSLNPLIKPALKINGCNLNEIHYFDSDLNYSFGLNWYKNQMPIVCRQNLNEQVFVIEKTPGYFRKEKTIKRIKNYKKDVKLILIVRNPVKRLQSELTHCDYRQKKQQLNRTCLEMNKYYENIFKNFNTTALENDRFVRNSLYYLDLIKWTQYFKINESIIVIDGENFITNPWVELNKIENFIGLNASIGKESFIFDKEKNFYCLNTSKGSCLGKNKGRKSHVNLSTNVKENFKQYFLKWNLLFYDLIGQNFNW